MFFYDNFIDESHPIQLFEFLAEKFGSLDSLLKSKKPWYDGNASKETKQITLRHL